MQSERAPALVAAHQLPGVVEPDRFLRLKRGALRVLAEGEPAALPPEDA